MFFWTSSIVPSLNKAPILAIGRLHGPLNFVAFAQELSFLLVISCEGLWVLPLASLAAGLRRSALRSRLMTARQRHNICRLYYLCVFPGS